MNRRTENIETISTAQDVLTIKLSEAASPQLERNDHRLMLSLEHFQEKWQALAAIPEQVTLQATP